MESFSNSECITFILIIRHIDHQNNKNYELGERAEKDEALRRYFRILKYSLPELPSLDLIMLCYNYSAIVSTNPRHLPTGIISTLSIILKYVFCRTKYVKKCILNDITLYFPCCSNTIVKIKNVNEYE